MIKPSVGRVVWVSRPGDTLDVQQPEAALIVYVHDDRKINVAGFDHSGAPFAAIGIPLLQDDDPKPEGRFACWMPFQKGQAQSTEELEKKLLAATQLAADAGALGGGADGGQNMATQPTPAPSPAPDPAPSPPSEPPKE